MYSSAHDVITHIAVQLQHNDRLCYCTDCTNCTAVDSWKKCTKVMTVATVCIEMVLQWHCMVCSKEIGICCTLRHKLLDRERSV